MVTNILDYREAKECRKLDMPYDWYVGYLYQAYADYLVPLSERVYYRL